MYGTQYWKKNLCSTVSDRYVKIHVAGFLSMCIIHKQLFV